MAVDYPTQETYQQRPRRRWGRRLLITLIVLLVVLGGLLAVADRVAADVAEGAIADQVTQEMAKQEVRSAPPEVGVGGFPFLTQVLAGKYESISILLRDLEGPAQGRTVRVPELEVHARDVAASIQTLRSGQGDVVARTVEGTATISYGTVSAFIDQEGLTLTESGGKLSVTAPLEVLGQRLTVRGNADLTVDEGQVAIRFADLTADGLPDIPAARALVNAYAQQISVQVPLPALPYGLEVQEVRALPEGLAVTASAQDVPLNSAK